MARTAEGYVVELAHLDRESPVPLWSQLLDDLRRRLAAGEFDDIVPGELELAEHYEVSRSTVRDALRRLRAEGLVTAERGRRSRRLVHRQPLGALWSMFRAIESGGRRQHSDVLTLDVRTDAVAARQLGLPARAPLLYLERLRRVDGEPLAHDRAWLPARLARPLLAADFTHTALYDELSRRCGIEPDGGSETVGALLPDPQLRRLLGLDAVTAVLTFDRLSRRGSEAVEWRQSSVRADRFRLHVDWDPAVPRRVELSGSLQPAD